MSEVNSSSRRRRSRSTCGLAGQDESSEVPTNRQLSARKDGRSFWLQRGDQSASGKAIASYRMANRGRPMWLQKDKSYERECKCRTLAMFGWLLSQNLQIRHIN